MKTRIQVLCCLVLAALAPGCAMPPPAEGTTYSAYKVGDRSSVMFDEIVVSLPLRGAIVPYQNLHVALAAVVNVQKKTYSSASYGAEDILRRLETRVAARLTEMLSSLGEQTLFDTPALRNKALTEAQAVVDEALGKWEYGADYRVEMVIVSWYWSDASVGRVQQQRRGWWW